MIRPDEDPDLPQPLRVLVTGSRTWPEPLVVVNALDRLLLEHHRLLVIHGACPRGSDAVAHNWVWTRLREGNLVGELACPADWERHGKRAGILRNWRMVVEGRPDIGLAFIHNNSPGTKNCIREMQRNDVPRIVFRIDDPDGTVHVERFGGAAMEIEGPRTAGQH